MPTTVKQVNKALAKAFPGVILVQGKGYCYISSDDENLQLQISGLYTSSIPVCKVSQQSVEQWVSDVERVLEDSDRFGLDRQPVSFSKFVIVRRTPEVRYFTESGRWTLDISQAMRFDTIETAHVRVWLVDIEVLPETVA